MKGHRMRNDWPMKSMLICTSKGLCHVQMVYVTFSCKNNDDEE